MDYKKRSLKPKNLSSNINFESTLKLYLNVFEKDNKDYPLLFKDFKNNEDPIIKNLEKLFKIPRLNFIQTMAFHALEAMF